MEYRIRNAITNKYITKEHARNYFMIVLGTILMALATNMFYTPAEMVPGGFTGIAIILQHVTKKPVWLWNIILNIPLIFIALKIRGWQFMRRTLLASSLFSLWLFIIPERGIVEDNLFLVALAGGGLMGSGLGLVFCGSATTGGTDTLAAIVQRYLPYLNTAKILPVLDAVVIMLSVKIFGLEISMYAIMTVLLTGNVADRVLKGQKDACLAYIISDSYEEIAEAVINGLNRGATILSGKGTYTDMPKQVLLCAVDRKQSAMLKEIVSEIDKNAFFILTDATEVRGNGFLAYGKNEM